jgi:hypothetical protein
LLKAFQFFDFVGISGTLTACHLRHESANIVVVGKTGEENAKVKNLKKLRVMTGRGQYWLSKQTGIERSRLSLIENLRIEASESEIAAIEKALVAAMRENLAQFRKLSGTEVNAA